MAAEHAILDDDTQQDTDSLRQYVTFEVDEQSFAFPMAAVLEIVRVPLSVAVPLTPAALIGLANLRGTVLPVLDLRTLLGVEVVAPNDATRVVVADVGQPVGLVVDRVSRVINVELELIEDAAGLQSTINADLLTGVVKNVEEQGLVQLLDVNKVVMSEFASILRALEGHCGSATGLARNLKVEEEHDDDTLQLVSFVVDEQEYAFDINEVEEIVRVPAEISGVPLANDHVLGLIDLRGRLLPLVVLRRMFRLQSAELEDRNRILVISLPDRPDQSVGIVVDQVREVLRVPTDVQDRVPEILSRTDGLNEIGLVCRLENGKRLVSVLSAGALFQNPAVLSALDTSVAAEENLSPIDAVEMESGEDDVTQMVVFSLADQEFGVLIESVQEITRVPTEMKKVPKTPEFIEGIVNLRSTVLPVVDMRVRFGLERIERNDRQRILVLNVDGLKTGFVTDSVLEVLRIPTTVIEESPRLSEDQARVMGRVANLKDSQRMIQVLDVAELLDDKERSYISEEMD